MSSLGGNVPLNVQTLSGLWTGRPGWNWAGTGVPAPTPEFRLAGTVGLYTVLVLAPSWVTSMATLGGNSLKPWWAQIGPGGRPSIGPVSPGWTPSSAGFNGCWVVLAWAVGAGFSVVTGFRGRTSNRSIGCVNGWTPNSGLGGKPVGMFAAAKVLGANGLRPFFKMMVPAAVNSPSLTRSRREICPWDHAARISQRFRRACSASLSR